MQTFQNLTNEIKQNNETKYQFKKWTNPPNIWWSSRRLEDVFKTSLEDFFNTYSEQQFLVIFGNLTIFEHVSKTSWRHLARRLEDVLKDKNLLCWRSFEDALKTSWRYVLRHFEDVLEINKMCTGDICI